MWHQSAFFFMHVKLLSSKLTTVNHLLFTVHSIWLGIYRTCCKCCKYGVVKAISCSELLDIFLKAFSCCVYGVHDVQAFNVLTNQFLTLKTTHSEKWVNQSFHILLQRGAGPGFWVHFCVLYTQLYAVIEGLIQRILITPTNPLAVSSFLQMPHKMNRWAVSF